VRGEVEVWDAGILTSGTAQAPARLWQLGQLNHVAIAVPDLAKATALYRDVMGAQVSAPQVC
jgi:catechol-2,3-dioxygenase